MSRFALCSIFVVLCAVQLVCAKHDWEDTNHVEGAEKDAPFVILERQERSSRPRKPNSKTLRQLEKQTKVSRSPCECSDGSCTCCAKFRFNGKSDKSCATVNIPDGKTRSPMVRYSFNFNDNNSQIQAPIGRDPKGMCQPFPRIPNSEVCSRFHSTKVENGKIRFCLTMEAKYYGYLFYSMDFDCVTYDIENQREVGNK